MLEWRKSSHSAGNGQCVETSDNHDSILFRDSKHPDGPVLSFSHAAMTAFISRIKTGEFDLM